MSYEMPSSAASFWRRPMVRRTPSPICRGFVWGLGFGLGVAAVWVLVTAYWLVTIARVGS